MYLNGLDNGLTGWASSQRAIEWIKIYEIVPGRGQGRDIKKGGFELGGPSRGLDKLILPDDSCS